MSHPIFRLRSQPYSDMADDLKLIREYAVEFFCAGSGGLGQYTGRVMVTSHKGMNISEAEFVAVLDEMLQVLDQHNIDEETRKDVLAIAYLLKNDIIQV